MSASMQRAQRILLMVLPIVFIPFILNFPAGLMIYWLTTNLWTTGQGFITRTADAEARAAGADKKSSRTPPKEAPPQAEKTNGPEAIRHGRRRTATPVVAGPPRRVKRKRSGGGRRR